MLRITLLFAIATLLCACSSDSEVREPQRGDASPLLIDLTQPEREPGEPVDPKTCKHAWVPSQAHSHPYQTVVNGMVMTRHCFAQRCHLCGKVRHECERARAQQKRARTRRR